MQKGIVQNVEGAIMLKDIDKAQGRIQGYFAVFGNIDSDKDMIVPGAFKRTIQNDGHRIKHLWQHDPTKPLAAPKVSEDSYGLLFDSVISKTSLGKDVIQLYLDGVVNEHSIGYNVVKKASKSGYTELQELKLWEGSTVTFAANERALVTSVKNMTPEQARERMNNVSKAMDRGRYENEEIFGTLEVYYKELKRHSVAPSLDITPSEVKSILMELEFQKNQLQVDISRMNLIDTVRKHYK